MTTKVCKRCLEEKPVDDFHKASYVRADGSPGRQSVCKPCNVIKSREWYRANPDRAKQSNRERAARRRDRLGEEGARRYDRNMKIRRKYGITIEDWDRMLAEQGSKCAICDRDFDGRKICVDHSHETGRVRGLLCDVCNQGLGYFEDDPQRLRAAARYVEIGKC